MFGLRKRKYHYFVSYKMYKDKKPTNVGDFVIGYKDEIDVNNWDKVRELIIDEIIKGKSDKEVTVIIENLSKIKG